MNQFKSVIEKVRTRGTIAPSSRFLVNRMLSKIDYSHDVNLLQLGFGTGVFAKELIRRMTPASRLTVFEIDSSCRKHVPCDDRVTFIWDSAENISSYYQDHVFDHVVSTLPFGWLPEHVREKIFQEVKAYMKPSGTFLQYQYSLISKGYISRFFGQKPKIDFELFNIPPAFIYEVTSCG